jgi:hypothetical protein
MFQELENARASVQANPADGQAWLALANKYRSLSVRVYNFPSIFCASYLHPGLVAYQKATELLPNQPAPHIGIALLTLASYMRDTNAPSEVVKLVQNELQIAKDLEQAHPEQANEGDPSTGLVEDAFSIYFSNATATAETSNAAGATQTGASTWLSGLSATSSPHPTKAASLLPSILQQYPSPTLSTLLTPEAGQIAGQRLPLVILLNAGVVALLMVSALLIRRFLGKS